MSKIDQYLKKQNKIIQEDREKTLIALGLTEKEYAPDDENRNSSKYPYCDYVNNVKRYYREVAISVTDEEYAQILSATKQVEEIKEREERKKEQSRASQKFIKKWTPVFVKPENENFLSSIDDGVDNGRSKLASRLRLWAWVLDILAFIIGVVIAIQTESFIAILISLGAVATQTFIYSVLAVFLDYFAELTCIAKNGFKYTETGK